MGKNHTVLTGTGFLRAAAIFLAAAALLCALPARAQFDDADTREDLILDVMKEPHRLSDGLIGIQQGSRYYLPLTELSEIFNFPVDADIGRSFASGWYLNEDNSYSIDAERGELVVKGQKRALEAEEIIVDDLGGAGGEMYVLLELLNEIWPVDMDVDLADLRLNVATETKLPFELSLEREEKRRISLARAQVLTPATARTDLPYVPNDYRLFSLPTLDFDQEIRWDNNAKELTGRTTLNGLQDLGFMSANYATNLDYNEGRFRRPSAVRLNLERKAYGDDTLLLGLKQFETGDTRINMRDLVDGGASGRGFLVSSEQVERRLEFDEILIEGRGLPGWEVELYRNEELLEFGTVDQFGEYRFENVALNVGNNNMRIVLYGPQGQVEERIEKYTISGGLLKPGKISVDAGMVDKDRPFILLEKANPALPGLARSAYVAHGISTTATLFGSYSDLPAQTGDIEQYASIGTMVSAFGGFGQAELYKQVNGGRAVDLRFATNFGGLRLNTQTAFYKDFESPDTGFAAAAKKFMTEIKANTTFKLPFGNLGLQLDTEHTELVSGDTTTRVNTQQSLGRAGLRLTHTTDTILTNDDHETSTGRADITYRLREWQMRAGLDYNIFPRREASTGNFEIRYKTRDNFSAAVTAQHNILTSDTQAGLQFGDDFGDFLGSIDIDWIKHSGIAVVLRASAALAPFGEKNSYIMSSRKLSNDMPLRARVFLDKNADGVFTEGDEPIKEARVLIDGRGTSEETGEDGYLIAASMSGEGLAAVELDKGSLYDPYFKPSGTGYRTVIRPGGMPDFNFPVVESGAVEGTIYYSISRRPVQGIKLQLVDDKGAVTAETESAYDGYYGFEFISPGTYTVQADPSYDTINVPPQSVVVTSEDPFPKPTDLQLLEQAGEDGITGADADTIPQAEGESGRVAHTPTQSPVIAVTEQPASTSTAATSAAVTRVRIGEHPGKVRLVLDLSAPAQPVIEQKWGGTEVLVKIPGTAWQTETKWNAPAGMKALGGYFAQTNNGETQLRLMARSKMEVTGSGALPPGGGNGHRFYIDLKEK